MYALAGILLAVGLTFGAYALAGNQLSSPAQPIHVNHASPAASAPAKETQQDRQQERDEPPGSDQGNEGPETAGGSGGEQVGGDD
jgi:hypothetical protein